MTLDQLTPDIALANLFNDKVEVQTSATEKHTIKCYADGAQPQKGLGNEFLSVLWNGSARARATQMGCLEGNLALMINCKLLNSTRSGQTINKQRVNQILAQCQSLAHGVSAGGFFFSVDPQQVITPTTANLTTGYSTTVINIEWHEN